MNCLNSRKNRRIHDSFIFLLAFFVLVVLSKAEKFEIFACGLSDKLGIGESQARLTPFPSKVVLPEDVKRTKILGLSSSSNNHIIETPSSHFVWGLNENQRLSKAVFTEMLKFPIPQEIPKNVSLVDGGYIDAKIQKKILNFDQYTFVFSVRKDVSPYNLLKIELAGGPKNLPDIFGTTKEIALGYNYTTKSIATSGSVIIARSLHQFAPIFASSGNALVIDTNKVFDFVKTVSSYHSERQVCHQGQCIHLNYAGEMWLEQTNTTLDSRYLGLPLEVEGSFIRPRRNNQIITEIFDDKKLYFSTKEGRIDLIRNIFGGQSLQTIVLTKSKKFYGFGNNKFNILGFSGAEMNQDFVFPPTLLSNFPKPEEIRQISIGFTHTLILLQNSTVLGIGSNLNGELGRNDSDVFRDFIQIQFPENENACLKQKKCSIELVAAENEASFFVFNYGPEMHVMISPMCNGKSYLDIDSCSMQGLCKGETSRCVCFDETIGDNCDMKDYLDCSKWNFCSGNGVCVKPGKVAECQCNNFFIGSNCTIPVCGKYNATDKLVCSQHGKCVADDRNPRRSKCECDAGYQGKYCADGLKNLHLYFSGESTNLGKTQSEFSRFNFLDTQARDESVMTHFTTNPLYSTATFMIDDQFHSVGFFPSLGSLDNVGFYHPTLIEEVPDSDNIVEMKIGSSDAWLKTIRGYWRSIGKRLKIQYQFSEEAFHGSQSLVPETSALWFMKDGALSKWTEKGIAEYQFVETPTSTTPKKFTKICRSYLSSAYDNLVLVLLGLDGTAFVQTKYVVTLFEDFRFILSEDFKKIEIDKDNSPITDIECVGSIFLVKTKGKWYSYSFSAYDHVGHKAGRNKFGEVRFDTFLPSADEKVLDWSISESHALILSQNRFNKTKSLWTIGNNKKGQFGWPTAPSYSSTALKVQIDDKIVDNTTKVFAGSGFSFIGNWKVSAQTVSQFSVCNGIPSYLTELVCNKGYGVCNPNGTCSCNTEFFKNYRDLTSLQKSVVTALNFNIKFSILGIINIDSKPLDSFASFLGFKGARSIPMTENCEIAQSRLGEINLLFDLFTNLLWLVVVILISCALCAGCGFISILFAGCALIIFLACGWAIVALCGTGVVTAVVSVVVAIPGFACCLNCCLKRQKLKDRDEFYEKLLPAELQQKDDQLGFARIDSSFFTVDFNDYKIESDIAAGGSGAQCFLAHHIKTRERVFMKMFVLNKGDGSGDDDQVLKEFQTEIRLLTRLKHHNIVLFQGFFFSPITRRVGYVCEFCEGGSLSNFIKKFQFRKIHKKSDVKSKSKASAIEEEFGLEKKINYLIQIAKGMRYLHTKGIIFRDLKPHNVLIGENDTLKITDFGISRIVNDTNDQTEVSQMTIRVGTAFYKAPEVILGKGDYNTKVDVFSYGIMMFELLFETMEPFGNFPPINVDERISRDPEFRPKIPDNYLQEIVPNSEEVIVSLTEESATKKKVDILIEMMKKCWDHHPTARPDFADIVLTLTSIEG